MFIESTGVHICFYDISKYEILALPRTVNVQGSFRFHQLEADSIIR